MDFSVLKSYINLIKAFSEDGRKKGDSLFKPHWYFHVFTMVFSLLYVIFIASQFLMNLDSLTVMNVTRVLFSLFLMLLGIFVILCKFEGKHIVLTSDEVIAVDTFFKRTSIKIINIKKCIADEKTIFIFCTNSPTIIEIKKTDYGRDELSVLLTSLGYSYVIRPYMTLSLEELRQESLVKEGALREVIGFFIRLFMLLSTLMGSFIVTFVFLEAYENLIFQYISNENYLRFVYSIIILIGMVLYRKSRSRIYKITNNASLKKICVVFCLVLCLLVLITNYFISIFGI